MFLGILFIMYVVTNTYTVVHIMEEMKSINAITFVMVYMIFLGLVVLSDRGLDL